jgi:hypothetical protein
MVLQYRAEFGNGPDDKVSHQFRIHPSFALHGEQRKQ